MLALQIMLLIAAPIILKALIKYFKEKAKEKKREDNLNVTRTRF